MLLYDLILTVLERSGSVYSVYSESHSLKTWTHPRLSCQMKVGRLTSETMFFFPECRQSTKVANYSSLLFPYCAVKPWFYIQTHAGE